MLPFVLWGIAAVVGVGLCVAFWDEIKDFLSSAWDWVVENFKKAKSEVRSFVKVIGRKIYTFLKVFQKKGDKIIVTESSKKIVGADEIPEDIYEALKRKGEVDISDRDELDGLSRW